ncbi:hypothetical protein [Clostridium sp. B9]
MNLFSLSILLTLSILTLPILVGLAYITLNKSLPDEDHNISYEEF